MTVDDRLTTTTAARRLGLTPRHVARLAAAGVLPHDVTPLGRLFPREAVDRFARERASRAAAREAEGPPAA